MASKTYVDRQEPAVDAEWLNDVDALVYDIFEAPTTKAGARNALGLVINDDVQAHSDELDQIAALSPADGGIIIGDGTAWTREQPATARVSLGVDIGSDVQAWDQTLDELSNLGTVSDDEFIVGTGAGTYAFESGTTVRASLNVYGIGQVDALIDDLSGVTDPAGARTNLGLVAGGDGDIWVEKAGDTMSGDLDMGDNAITNIDWTTSDDGAGSGLDADLLDGEEGTYYVDSDNFTGTDWTDLTDGGETALHEHASIDVNTTVLAGASPTFSTNLQNMRTIVGPVGHITGGIISDAGGETVDVTAGEGMIRDSDDDFAQLDTFTWDAVSGQAIPTDSIRYVTVEYNAGSPQVFFRSTDEHNYNDRFPIGVVINDNGTLWINNKPHSALNAIGRQMRADFEVRARERSEAAGGLIIGETGTRNVQITAGVTWFRNQREPFDAFDSSGTDTFDRYYRDGAGGFTREAAQTQVPNTQYDDGTGALATLANNKWVNQWFYLSATSEVVMLYGRDEFNTFAAAQDESPPQTLPRRLQVGGLLLGRFIYKKSAATAQDVQTAFFTVFTGTSVVDHGNLAGLSDDDHPQYAFEDGTKAFTGTITVEQSGGGAQDFVRLRDSTDAEDFVIHYDGDSYQLRDEQGGAGDLWLDFLAAGAGIEVHQSLFAQTGVQYNSEQGTLGTTQGDELVYADWEHKSGNTDHLSVRALRRATASGWESSTHEIRRLVDVTDMGFIRFDDGGTTSNSGGLSFGYGSNVYLDMAHTGVWTLGGDLDFGGNDITTLGRIISDDRDFVVGDFTNTMTNFIWYDWDVLTLKLGGDQVAVSFRGDVSFESGHDLDMSGNDINDVDKLRITGTGDASLSSTTHGFQIGADNTANVIIDTNEIMARNNGAAATLRLQLEGGSTIFGAGNKNFGGGDIVSSDVVTGLWQFENEVRFRRAGSAGGFVTMCSWDEDGQGQGPRLQLFDNVSNQVKTVFGGGVAAVNIHSGERDTMVFSNTGASTDETLYLSSDSAAKIITNLSAGVWGDREEFTFGSDGVLTMPSGGELDMTGGAITSIDWANSDDGPGSGLDADTVDGFEGSDLALFGIQFSIIEPDNDTYTLDRDADFAYTIDDAVHITDSGSIDVQIQINGSNAGTSFTADSTETTTSQAVSVSAGDNVTLVLTNNSSADGLAVKLKCSRD